MGGAHALFVGLAAGRLRREAMQKQPNVAADVDVLMRMHRITSYVSIIGSDGEGSAQCVLQKNEAVRMPFWFKRSRLK